MKPTDLVTADTLRFYEEHLPARSRILDAGCGAGNLAAKLKDAGHHVIGLDADEGAVEKTLALGVEARHGDFFRFEEEPFDAICFSFSLHHIFPLDEAVEQAERLLVPGGLLLAEEFAWDGMDQITARWFYGTWSLLESCGVLAEEEAAKEHHCHSHEGHADKRTTPPTPQTPLDEWMDEHHHEPPLHTGQQMREGIERRLDSVRSEQVPTLFTDFAVALEPSQRRYDVACKLLELERSLIDHEAIVPLGLRMAAKRKG